MTRDIVLRDGEAAVVFVSNLRLPTRFLVYLRFYRDEAVVRENPTKAEVLANGYFRAADLFSKCAGGGHDYYRPLSVLDPRYKGRTVAPTTGVILAPGEQPPVEVGYLHCFNGPASFDSATHSVVQFWTGHANNPAELALLAFASIPVPRV